MWPVDIRRVSHVIEFFRFSNWTEHTIIETIEIKITLFDLPKAKHSYVIQLLSFDYHQRNYLSFIIYKYVRFWATEWPWPLCYFMWLFFLDINCIEHSLHSNVPSTLCIQMQMINQRIFLKSNYFLIQTRIAQ